MTAIDFIEWVNKEEKRIKFLGATKSKPSFSEKKNLALEVIHKLDASKKADNFKSMIIPENKYRETRVSFSTEYSRNYIGILLVVGSDVDDLIEIYSDLDEDDLRYWAVAYYDKYFDCYDIGELIEYLENYQI